MKRNISRFLFVLVAVVLLAALCVPAFAASGSSYEQKVGWWEWVTHFPVLKEIWGYASGAVCPKSDDGYHHSSSYEIDRGNGYFTSICSFCGQKFKAYESDLQQSYQQQVSDLPATSITSSGSLIWQAQVANLDFLSFITSWTNISLDFSSADSSANTFPWSYSSSSTFSVYDWFPQCGIINLPVSGSYCELSGIDVSLRGVQSNGIVYTYTLSHDKGTFAHYDISKYHIIYKNSPHFPSSLPSFVSASFLIHLPVYEIIPDSAIDFNSNTQYNVNTRPTTITGGNYGIVGDDNQITTVTDNRKIVNEGDNIYYNPATGQTQNITDWSYDYSSRIYNITLDTGDKVSVEYGDENISIVENKVVEGDTIVNNYTIYYMIDGSGDNPDPTPDPGPTATTCPHSWKEVSRTEPTCTSPGSVSFSCEKCGETKTDKLPATGHTWQVLRTVQTAYDEEGNLVQQGYTIYQCAVCSEQYKDTEGTGPPGGGDKDDDKETIWDKIANFFGSIVDGIAGIFEAVLGKLLDALTALSELLMGKIKDVVEVVLSVFDELPALFGGFLDFLGVVFPFLPPEITLLLTFGVIAVVFIGIIKAIRR